MPCGGRPSDVLQSAENWSDATESVWIGCSRRFLARVDALQGSMFPGLTSAGNILAVTASNAQESLASVLRDSEALLGVAEGVDV